MLVVLEDLQENGNFRELEDAMSKILFKMQRKEAEEYHRAMMRILDKDEISKNNVRRFHKLSSLMSIEVLDPLAERLEALRIKYDDADSEEEENAILEEMEKIYEIISEFSIEDGPLNKLYAVIQDNESLHYRGIGIERMRLKSKAYREIGPEGDSLEEAKEFVDDKIQKFKNVHLEDWRCHARAKQGNPACATAARKDMQRRMSSYKRAYKSFQTFYANCQRQMYVAQVRPMNFFGPSPVYEARKCKRQMKMRMARIQAQGRRTFRYMETRGKQANRYQASYQSYLEEQYKAEMDSYGDGDDSFLFDHSLNAGAGFEYGMFPSPPLY